MENVSLLEDSRDKVLKNKHYVCKHLGDLIFVDAGVLGSYFHQPRWLWTNLAPPSSLATTFSAMLPPFDQKMDDILNSH